MRTSRRQVWCWAVVVLWLLGVITVAVLAAVLEYRAPDRLLVVDTDAGADDAVAILELLRAEVLWGGGRRLGTESVARVLAITCVQGNTGVANVTKNVFAILENAGRGDVPVYVGADVPLMPPGPIYSDYFGKDGFGDFLPPGPTTGKPQDEHAAVALVRLAKERRGQLTLVCIGPLTNVALAARLDPNFLDNLKDLYILGGAAHGYGNSRPGAEFNIRMDAEAALIVFEAIPSNRPAFLLPWEAVLDAELTGAWRRDVLGATNTTAVQFLNQAERVALEGSSVWDSGDGLMAAHLIDTNVIRAGKAVRVEVLGGTGPGRGVTLVDHGNTTGLPANIILIETPDQAAFQRLLLRLLGSS